MKETKIKSALLHHYIEFGLLIRSILPVIFLFYYASSNATIKTAVGNSGQGWNNANNWSPTGVPQHGDTIIIPVSFTISVKGAIYSAPFPRLIVKIYGTLDFDPSGKIDLAPTAALGIYAGGSITSNGTSSELINIGGVNKFNGQVDGTVTGPRFANASTGASPNGFNVGVLAIKLILFNYQKINDAIKLNWTASHSNNNDFFEIQRSKDGSNWLSLASLPVTGNLYEIYSYAFTDLNPEDLNFYRIKLVNFDIQDSYSKTLVVRLSSTLKNLSVFPNPAHTETKIVWENLSPGPVNISILNATMITVMKLNVTEGDNYARIYVNDLPSGIYTVILSDSKNQKEFARLLVNK